MKKIIYLLSFICSTFTFAQVCCNVIDGSGISVISSNGACIVTTGAESCSEKENDNKKITLLAPAEVKVLARALEGVKFKTDSDELLSESFLKLDAVAALMQGHRDFKLTIDGYTDNTGTSEYNHKLSHKRAESAKAYLVKKGVKAEKISTHGYGEENPIGDNSTIAGRTKNRRVEFKVAL